MFLHKIGKSRLQDLRDNYLTHGLVPRLHGHTGRVAPNDLVLDEVQAFVLQYAETNILLPGRIPRYKRDDLQILPSSTTKKALWLLFQDTAASLATRAVSYSSYLETISWACYCL